jgi:hypothetical protein
MKKSRQPRSLIRAVAAASLATAVMCGPTSVLRAADTKTDSTNAVVAAHPEAKAGKKTTKKITGAELYQINCNRCHAERYATEFTAAQWKTIMLHMRVRANLPASQAKLVLKYLQEDAGN